MPGRHRVVTTAKMQSRLRICSGECGASRLSCAPAWLDSKLADLRSVLAHALRAYGK